MTHVRGTPLVDSRLMTAIDRAAQEEYGIPAAVLMENAGARLWALLRSELPSEGTTTVVFVAGRGNNGGDALVMARHCAAERRHRPMVVVLAKPLKELAAIHCASCEALGVPVWQWSTDHSAAMSALADAEWIVDGLTGTGLSGGLTGAAAELVAAMNDGSARIFSIDAPSGAGDGMEPNRPVVQADWTATIGLPKRTLYVPAVRPLCGRIDTVAIGFPPALIDAPKSDERLLDEHALDLLLPPLAPDSFKNRRGVVSVYAGSPGMTGAAVLSSTAAARAGAGMVRLFCDPDIYPIVAGRLVSIMAVPTGTPGGELDGLDAERVSALVVGPGWGRTSDRRALLEAAVASGIPGVLDADGLRLLEQLRAEGVSIRFSNRWVLTPHPGEFAGLSGVDSVNTACDPAPALRAVSSELEAVVVLKGHVTWICDPTGAISVVDGMIGELGTAGSGDVLAGVIAGLLARGAPPRAAAEAGVLLHAAAGRRLARTRGFFLAEHLLEEVSLGAAGVWR